MMHAPAKKNIGQDKGNNKAPQNTVATQALPAATIAEAQTLAIYPKRFEMSSVLLWQAREAAIREWGQCN